MGYCKNENTWSCGIRFLDKAQPAGVNRRAVSDAQTSVRRAAAVSKKDAKASKSFDGFEIGNQGADAHSRFGRHHADPLLHGRRVHPDQHVDCDEIWPEGIIFFWETPFKIAPLEVEIVVRKLDDFRRLGPGAVAGS
jgi:hypothetical protein